MYSYLVTKRLWEGGLTMARQNVYRELNRKMSPVPAREVTVDWARIDADDSMGPWDEEYPVAEPWEQAFEQGAEQARDEYFENDEDSWQ